MTRSCWPRPQSPRILAGAVTALKRGFESQHVLGRRQGLWGWGRRASSELGTARAMSLPGLQLEETLQAASLLEAWAGPGLFAGGVSRYVFRRLAKLLPYGVCVSVHPFIGLSEGW